MGVTLCFTTTNDVSQLERTSMTRLMKKNKLPFLYMLFALSLSGFSPTTAKPFGVDFYRFVGGRGIKLLPRPTRAIEYCYLAPIQLQSNQTNKVPRRSISDISRPSRSFRYMSPQELERNLGIPDLTDPTNGSHAVNLLIERLTKKFSERTDYPPVEIRRCSPVSTVRDEFDNLYFPPDSLNRSPIYTRYISPESVLRTQTTSAIPPLFKTLSPKKLEDYMVFCPGICFRRDVLDRKHVGEPHQLDIWRIKKGNPRFSRTELVDLIEQVLQVAAPGLVYRANEVQHPYTENGLEVEVQVAPTEWMEILECGEVSPKIFEDCGLDSNYYSGLAMGMGLDRLVMLLKGFDDIRLLRSSDPRISSQMKNLDPYTAVSNFPPITRDFSVAVPNEFEGEDICEIVRKTLKDRIGIVEQLDVIEETQYRNLPDIAIERLGIKPHQKNVLFRIVFRSNERTLVRGEVNTLYDEIYKAVHSSTVGFFKDLNKGNMVTPED